MPTALIHNKHATNMWQTCHKSGTNMLKTWYNHKEHPTERLTNKMEKEGVRKFQTELVDHYQYDVDMDFKL